MNLKELLEKYRIEIPILQRDYAQGRKSQSKIANEFLSAIFNVLNGKRQSLHIDFIYGYQENDKFLLIDGQQRITTLWLLHFYLYKKAGCLEQIKDLLAKFSYNTRRSSANFCKNLLKKDFDINEKPSEAIRNKGGEFEKAENLNNDPTIKAMLNMLDWIFEEVKSKREIKKLAENLDSITFYLFDMGKFELGEELYIKMNARGKQLSKYENLKSFIEKDSKISKEQKLLESMDTNWSDYFFDSKNTEKFDARGCNFLHYATLFFALENKEIESKDIKEAIENPNQPINEFYEPLQNVENIKLLDRVVSLCSLLDTLEIKEVVKIKDSSFFDKILSYPDICYFFSILFFVKENREVENIDKSAFNDYLRVSRHFIENHRLDNPEEHISSFFRLFKHLSQGYENIYQFLIDNPIYEFHKNIYTLEVKKAKLILDSREGGENWEKILNQTSEHKILKGWVDFLLDFSDEKFDFKSYSEESEFLKQPNLHKFQQYADITMQILDKEGFLDKNLTLFQRAFLCIGNFSFYSTNWFYGNSPADIFRDREALNWILKGNRNNLRLPYFKNFLDDLLKSKGENLVDKMREIIKQTDLSQKEWWEQLLIGEPALFDFLNERKEVFQRYSRIRYFDNINKVELLPGLRNTTNVKDLLDYSFCCYCKDKGLKVSEYECSEKQYGDKFELLSHFSLDNMKVLCNSMESKIYFDDKEYPINLEKGNNIFNEFGRILKLN
ncbi:DUF262 domain-containing protein [Helicobacter cholecystus]|uniref:DUF262 domain-containing protein n=1 Tax=Helicobacter cholecystus TaxID=45498 RepID=A0A3D8IX96_9HELI|nr:DUF262 domain-containing protein [Helicobacter cholecystus]RDU69683.1 DUF262 domain-containing protein [Helicobacter cholecystus]VEJ24247.1 Protein of uncharacterised function DUF262 [Helicobacter cholecystus]